LDQSFCAIDPSLKEKSPTIATFLFCQCLVEHLPISNPWFNDGLWCVAYGAWRQLIAMGHGMLLIESFWILPNLLCTFYMVSSDFLCAFQKHLQALSSSCYYFSLQTSACNQSPLIDRRLESLMDQLTKEKFNFV